MSAAEIIKELPRLSETDRRQIRQALLEIANQDPDIALCNQAALEGAILLDRMEDEDPAVVRGEVWMPDFTARLKAEC
ncbi:MAG TPA: hypothetical protein VGN61_02795 [Verrucomicrobiae bacterium]